MGANGSKGFQQVGAVATGLTSWMSGARKRTKADTEEHILNGVADGHHTEQYHDDAPDDTLESPQKRSKLGKSESGKNDEDTNQANQEGQLEEIKASRADELGNGDDKVTLPASEVDEGVGLDVAGIFT